MCRVSVVREGVVLETTLRIQHILFKLTFTGIVIYRNLICPTNSPKATRDIPGICAALPGDNLPSAYSFTIASRRISLDDSCSCIFSANPNSYRKNAWILPVSMCFFDKNTGIPGIGVCWIFLRLRHFRLSDRSALKSIGISQPGVSHIALEIKPVRLQSYASSPRHRDAHRKQTTPTTNTTHQNARKRPQNAQKHKY
mgnify:CR=1 FL=1